MESKPAMTTSQKQPLPWYKRPGGIAFLHLLRVVMLGFIVGPIATTVALALDTPFLGIPAALLIGLASGRLSLVGRLPRGLAGRYILPLCFIWVMGGAFFPYLVFVGLSGSGLSVMRFLSHVYVFGFLAGYVFCERRRAETRFPAWGWALFCLLLLLPMAHVGYGVYEDWTYASKRGHGFARVGGFSSTNLKPYDPRVPDARTARLNGPSTFTLRGTEGLPVLDGAEAAFPVYAAFAAACYPDLPSLTPEELKSYDFRGIREGTLRFTNTVYGFYALVDGEVDIFFGARPSARQVQYATDSGKELLLTPIGKEAFVFFVNEANPVDGLSSQQIQDIYSGRIRNWKALGGQDRRIMAFQRPEGSGSQTIMLRFMGKTEMERPLKDHSIGGMGGVIEKVSEYRNAPSAIGYSFLFFLTGLGRQPRIKLLAVDGVLPTPETIRSGTYPHVATLYAITIKGNTNPNIAPFLQWMQGEQGQELIEKVGYGRLR